MLDAGCGTGSLAATLAKVSGASKIVGIDPSKGFIEYARMQVADPRVIFELGDAQDLRYPDHTFDVCVALLAVDHIPDAPKATKEMRRITKTLGIVATAMWDRSHDNELYGCFWEAAEAIDPTAKRPFGRHGSYGSPEGLSQLWKGAGLTKLELTDLSMACQFSSFDELWQRCLDADSPPGVYMKSLSADGHEALKKKLRQNVLGNGPTGHFRSRRKRGRCVKLPPLKKQQRIDKYLAS